MTAYLDSSVVLRIVLWEVGALREWRAVQRGVASALVELECLRTLDRLRLHQRFRHSRTASQWQSLRRILCAAGKFDWQVELQRPPGQCPHNRLARGHLNPELCLVEVTR